MHGQARSTFSSTTPASSVSALWARFRSLTSRRSSRPISTGSSSARPKRSRAWRRAAKAGILGLTRALALEVASVGIRVNAVAPGFTRTKLIDQGLADGSLQEDWMVARVPMKRLAATQEIANAVRYLAGDEASYMTGQTIIVDGGWTIQGVPHAPEWLQSPPAE